MYVKQLVNFNPTFVKLLRGLVIVHESLFNFFKRLQTIELLRTVETVPYRELQNVC